MATKIKIKLLKENVKWYKFALIRSLYLISPITISIRKSWCCWQVSNVSGSLPRTQTVSEISGVRIHKVQS